MGDERSSLLQTAIELDEIELEEIQESDLVTGEFPLPAETRQSSAGLIGAPSHGSARGSVPPPVPAAAREARRSSAPPGSLPPPPPAAGISVPPERSRSGMYRIDAAARVPPLPTPAGERDANDANQQSAALGAQLRELRSHNDRLRLTLRLREDRIRELERTLQEQRKHASALEAELARLRAEPTADDLKRIPGVGPGFERALHAAGVVSFQQIAEWTPQDVERIAQQLRTQPARIVRGHWIEQARTLAGSSQTQ